MTILSSNLDIVSNRTMIRKDDGSVYDGFAGLGSTIPFAALSELGW